MQGDDRADSVPDTDGQGRRRAALRPGALIPFAAGVVVALLGFLLFTALNRPADTVTLKQVNQAVAEAMASATPPPPYSALVYRAVQPSLVLIQTKGKPQRDDSGGSVQEPARGLGSGVVISDRGQILTALHVVEGAQEIQVLFADGTEARAEIESSQPDKDIAVLQPDALPDILVPAVMGNPNASRVGDEAFAVGSPFGLYASLSAGVISGFERDFQAEGSRRRIEGLIQVDTAVNPGNSGGPLLNRYGQVIGIVVGILNPTDDEFFVGIGFAVPITVAASGAGGPRY
ncbi:MAG: trypsin-like peptidase domain-containing protein [Anaerolineae bacterium]|jgi:S1-C subfamily serine protease|nr:trypsin-like peptidase domain-containing protein [Anaerolineae bacterium]